MVGGFRLGGASLMLACLVVMTLCVALIAVVLSVLAGASLGARW